MKHEILWLALTVPFIILYSECLCIYANSSSSRNRRQSCTGFRCQQGPRECIDYEKICDGIENCQDGSDETNILCGNVYCPGDIFFRCGYGACIDLPKKCDGKKDCKDNTDEENCIIINKNEKTCKPEEFECNNGECIPVYGKCNGVVECLDGSDETISTCLNTFCPEIYFKCAYGACVDGDAKCNDVKDCYDNSDEKSLLCNLPAPGVTFAPPTGKNCETPLNPEHGSWSYYLSSTPYNPRAKVSPRTNIQLSCTKGWLPSETDEGYTKILVCTEAGWNFRSNIKCLKKCPEVYDTVNMNVTCKKTSGEIIPCTKATPGTTLTFKCRNYYEPRSHSYERRCQANGDWNKGLDKNECVPACGEKKVTATKLIVNGSTVEKGHYPWTVAIYQQLEKWEQICGGSLISLNLVLTAAHCVADDDGNALDPSYFEIAAGKYFRSYRDKRDKDTAKYSKLKSLIVHEDYQASHQNYKADIAILVLQQKLQLTQEIQPVCLEKSNIELIHPNQTGVFTGWGNTKASSRPSDTLQELELPYKDENQCRTEIPYEWFVKYYKTGDKICAGYYNRSISVCQGDSGGGLMFNHSEVYDGASAFSLKIKYHIIGVLSTGIQEKGQNETFVCDIQKSALYTKVPKYLSWIREHLSLNP